ncbi:MAG: DUF4870 domain-containing protein [Candidatus Acidiferrales bacterium]
MADTTLPAPTMVLTQDEKAYAGLAHALMMGTWWIGPLVIYLTKKESRFVAFHALQALLWQIIYTVVVFGGMIVFFVIVMVTTFSMARQPNVPPQPPVTIFLLFPFVWLFIMAAAAITFTLAIMYCLKAMRGEWAGYPVIGRWARKVVGF